MAKTNNKTVRRVRRKVGIRKRVFGTPERPRLTIFRSNRQVYTQVIDDVTGNTLTSACSIKMEKGDDIATASEVGKQLAEKAKAAGIEKVAFDRSGYKYHGRVKAMVEAARKGGLKF